MELSKFVSHRPKMSGELDPRKDSHSKENFRELCDSKISGLCLFYNMAILLS